MVNGDPWWIWFFGTFFIFQIRKMEKFFLLFYRTYWIYFESARENGPTSYYVSHFSGGNRSTTFIMKFMLRTTIKWYTRTVTLLLYVRWMKFFGYTSRQGNTFTILLWIVPMFLYNLMCMTCRYKSFSLYLGRSIRKCCVSLPLA